MAYNERQLSGANRPLYNKNRTGERFIQGIFLFVRATINIYIPVVGIVT